MNFGVPEVIVFLIGQCVVAAAIWGGIRADIKGMHYRLDALERRFDTLTGLSVNDTWNGGERRRR